MGLEVEGELVSYNGLVATARIWPVSYMDVVEDTQNADLKYVVTGFNGEYATLTPLFDNQVVSSSGRVVSRFKSLHFRLDDERILHSVFGAETGKIAIKLNCFENGFENKVSISQQFKTGVKGIDWFMPVGIGQRSVIIANAGVGKSTLIRYLLLHAEYDIAIVGLIGERGREVTELLEFVNQECIGKSIKIIVSISSESSIRRFFSFISATQVANYYRSKGKNVLLVIDSLTRVARAIREIGLQNGEIPVRQGLTPSVFTTLPKLLEVPGKSSSGAITAFYTLLTPENHDQDILAEEVKSLLDGHIILSRNIQQKGVYPALDLVHSLSRLERKFLTPEEQKILDEVRLNLKTLEQDRELMYLSQSMPPHLAKALAVEEVVMKWLMQDQKTSWTEDDKLEFLREVSSILYNKKASQRALNNLGLGSVF